jgi:hypothetical protein
LTAGSSSGSFTYPEDPDDDADTVAATLGLGGTTSHEFTIRQEDDWLVVKYFEPDDRGDLWPGVILSWPSPTSPIA